MLPRAGLSTTIDPLINQSINQSTRRGDFGADYVVDATGTVSYTHLTLPTTPYV